MRWEAIGGNRPFDLNWREETFGREYIRILAFLEKNGLPPLIFRQKTDKLDRVKMIEKVGAAIFLITGHSSLSISAICDFVHHISPSHAACEATVLSS